MLPASRLFDLCEELLAAVVEHYATEAVELPARQYVAAGPPAWDCELLAAWVEATSSIEGDPSVETRSALPASAGWAMRGGTFVLTLARCTPAIPEVNANEEYVPPTVEAEEVAAAALYADATLLLNALVTAVRNKTLAGCNSLAFLDWRVLGPEGVLVAGELRVRIGLTGLS